MIIPIILIAITFATNGISKHVIPSLQQSYNDFTYHKLEPSLSQSNEDVSSYINKKYQSLADEITREETGNRLYQNDQKLDDISEHNNYRVDERESKLYTTDMEAVKDDNSELEKEQGSNTNSQIDHSSNSKPTTHEREEVNNVDDRHYHLADKEYGNGKININSENSKEVDNKNTDHEDFEDHDEFKWPNESDEKYGHKGDENKFHPRFGKYGTYSDSEKFGEYSRYGGHRGYGCLELGYGEYC